MKHLRAIGRGLLVIGGLSLAILAIFAVIAYPIIGLPFAIIFFAWLIGGGPEQL